MIDKGFRRAMGFAFGLALMASYASAARAETYFDSIEAGGRERHFMIVRPDGAKPGHRLPTVIALHGALMTGRSMRRIFGLDDIAEHDRFAVVYPDGIRRRWNDGRTGTKGVRTMFCLSAGWSSGWCGTVWPIPSGSIWSGSRMAG